MILTKQEQETAIACLQACDESLAAGDMTLLLQLQMELTMSVSNRSAPDVTNDLLQLARAAGFTVAASALAHLNSPPPPPSSPQPSSSRTVTDALVPDNFSLTSGATTTTTTTITIDDSQLDWPEETKEKMREFEQGLANQTSNENLSLQVDLAELYDNCGMNLCTMKDEATIAEINKLRDFYPRIAQLLNQRLRPSQQLVLDTPQAFGRADASLSVDFRELANANSSNRRRVRARRRDDRGIPRSPHYDNLSNDAPLDIPPFDQEALAVAMATPMSELIQPPQPTYDRETLLMMAASMSETWRDFNSMTEQELLTIIHGIDTRQPPTPQPFAMPPGAPPLAAPHAAWFSPATTTSQPGQQPSPWPSEQLDAAAVPQRQRPPQHDYMEDDDDDEEYDSDNTMGHRC